MSCLVIIEHREQISSPRPGAGGAKAGFRKAMLCAAAAGRLCKAGRGRGWGTHYYAFAFYDAGITLSVMRWSAPDAGDQASEMQTACMIFS